jgi:hypothetical protein
MTPTPLVNPPPPPQNDSGTPPLKTKLIDGPPPPLKNPCMNAPHLCSLLHPQLRLQPFRHTGNTTASVGKKKYMCLTVTKPTLFFHPDPNNFITKITFFSPKRCPTWSQSCHYCTLLSFNRLIKEEHGKAGL